MRVRVYRNLRNKLLSVQVKTDKGWRVHGHYVFVHLKNCHFESRDAGRNRVRRTKRKNVHAWIEGDMTPNTWKAISPRMAKYNPYRNDAWIDATTYTKLKHSDVASVYCNGTVIYE